jgi:photosystem II stability/assembly factor-like uncharacterized protein
LIFSQLRRYIHLIVLGTTVLAVSITQGWNHPETAWSNKTLTDVSLVKINQWQQVRIGGGGYVTGVELHPQEPDLVYIRTDNGGAYRWNPQQQKWQNLLDNFPLLPWNYYGVEALALDPNNAALVYLALGKYTSGGNGRLWKSSDRGKTWVESDLQVTMGGDENKRWAGNRLAVSPGDSNLLLFGSRQNGLWRSTDGGLHWTKVSHFEAAPNSEIGIIAVAFDPQLPNQVYLSAYGDGIYQSNDAGVTWTKMKTSPVQAMRMVVAGDRTIYVTSDTSPGVSRYVNGVWQEITPDGYQGQVFNSVSVHPRHNNQVLVALGEVGGAKIFYSTDRGNHWTEKSARPNFTIPWWPEFFFSAHTSAVVFDPNYNQRVWLTDWFGVWRTDNFGENPATWTSYAQGHEQLVTFTLASPPQGAVLLSGVADVEGFYHHSLDTYPQDRLGYGKEKRFWNNYFQDTYSIAYCVSQPLHLVRVGAKRDGTLNTGASSTDGGLTWHKFAKFPDNAIPMRVAISATNPQQFVVIRSDAQPLQTTDGGNSWQQVSGLPNGITGPWNWAQSLAADAINGKTFYYYADGTFYRSDNGGLTFDVVNTSLPSVEDHLVKSIPSIEGEVWLSLDLQGLYVTSDRGGNFTQIPTVEQARLFAFGKPTRENDRPTLYLYGKVINQGEGLFRSSDRGKTWEKLSKIPLYNDQAPQTIRVLEASQQQSSLIFVGTDGRGIYYQFVK